VVVVNEGINYKLLLAKAARLFGLALLAAFLLYFLINVVVACATFAAAGMRQAWTRTAAIQPPRLSWEPPSLELVHPFSYKYRGLNCLILATFIPVFLYLIQARDVIPARDVILPDVRRKN
jgi:hypothetical protein